MDIKIYNLEDLLLTAIKSEVESEKVYSALATGVGNFMLKDRFTFFASEEANHKAFFEWLYQKNYPNRRIVLPEKTPVPLPIIRVRKGIAITEVIGDAMEAEKVAYDFYMQLSERFAGAPDIKNMLFYVASMEMGHYRILEAERENAANFESFQMVWPMAHVGA
jgi:rubrerythrin